MVNIGSTSITQGVRPAMNSGARPGFNGELHEPASGWQMLGKGYRVYNPVLMRCHSPDSLSPFGAGGFNGYAYCRGDPLNLADPSGHRPGAALMGVGRGRSLLSVIDDQVPHMLAIPIAPRPTPALYPAPAVGDEIRYIHAAAPAGHSAGARTMMVRETIYLRDPLDGQVPYRPAHQKRLVTLRDHYKQMAGQLNLAEQAYKPLWSTQAGKEALNNIQAHAFKWLDKASRFRADIPVAPGNAYMSRALFQTLGRKSAPAKMAARAEKNTQFLRDQLSIAQEAQQVAAIRST